MSDSIWTLDTARMDKATWEDLRKTNNPLTMVMQGNTVIAVVWGESVKETEERAREIVRLHNAQFSPAAGE